MFTLFVEIKKLCDLTHFLSPCYEWSDEIKVKKFKKLRHILSFENIYKIEFLLINLNAKQINNLSIFGFFSYLKNSRIRKTIDY